MKKYITWYDGFAIFFLVVNMIQRNQTFLILALLFVVLGNFARSKEMKKEKKK